MSAMTSLLGAVAGAGLMYVLDPVQGARRRALANDQLQHASRQMRDASGTVLRDARNRSRGLLATLLSGWRWVDVPDGVLEDRIRAKLGTLVRYARLVQVRSERGNVFLSGVVASDEIARLVRRIRRMAGVAGVENRLELRADPADLPGAQRPAPQLPRVPRLDVMRERWSPRVRASGATVGGGLLSDGVRRGGLAGLMLCVAGLLVLFRALTNEPLAGERDTERDTW
jgi:BON domain